MDTNKAGVRAIIAVMFFFIGLPLASGTIVAVYEAKHGECNDQ